MPEIHGKSKIGEGTFVAENVIIGYPGKNEAHLLKEGKYELVKGSMIGADCILRDYGVIYSQAELGDNVKTGHHYMVREDSVVGANTLIGSGVIIEDNVKVGKDTMIQSNVYIPTNSVIEEQVFLGPNVVLTNDRRMNRGECKLEGAIIKKGARIGANATILPGIVIGHDTVVGAGSVVTKDVPDNEIIVGVPARSIGQVPDHEKIC